MAVLLETSKGDIVIDLFVEDAPMTCKNFLKLCKLKYYNNSLFHNVQRDFIAQTGDPSGTGKGGDSLYGLLYGSQARFFDDEFTPKRKHEAKGCVGMASAGPNLNASQFYITLGTDLSSLDERHTLFGQVSEGLEVLEGLNEVPVDGSGRPLQNIRIRHTIILDDPFDDPPQLAELIPDASPPPTFEHGDRLEEDWVPEADERPAEEVEKEAAAAEAKNRAVVLEMIGDLPEADVKPPSNMLFVCKLNPVTTEEDLDIIFSRFGNVTSCDIIRDHKTGDSLCYAFIGYDDDQSCEAAYFKMNNVLIDDRRIKVDFSQSVAHIWKQFRRHGKAGGDAGTAAEANAHARGQQPPAQQQRQQQGPPTGSRYIDLKGPRQPDRGMLFDAADHEPDHRRQQQQVQPGDEPQHQRGSRARTRSRSRERRYHSRSRSREHKQKKQKKHHEQHHKHDKQRQPEHADEGRLQRGGHDPREEHRVASRAADAGRPHSSSRGQQQQQQRRDGDDRRREVNAERSDRHQQDRSREHEQYRARRESSRDRARHDSSRDRARRDSSKDRARRDSSRDRGGSRHGDRGDGGGRGYEREGRGSEREGRGYDRR